MPKVPKTLKLLLFISALASSAAKADNGSPLGSRAYILPAADPYSPVSIETSKAAASSKGKGFVMRDPIPADSKKVGNSKPDRHKAGMPIRKTSRMVFEKVAVQGRYSVPRVSFDRPNLDLDRADEPIKLDYREKIKESDSLLKEFDW